MLKKYDRLFKMEHFGFFEFNMVFAIYFSVPSHTNHYERAIISYYFPTGNGLVLFRSTQARRFTCLRLSTRATCGAVEDITKLVVTSTFCLLTLILIRNFLVNLNPNKFNYFHFYCLLYVKLFVIIYV